MYWFFSSFPALVPILCIGRLNFHWLLLQWRLPLGLLDRCSSDWNCCYRQLPMCFNCPRLGHAPRQTSCLLYTLPFVFLGTLDWLWSWMILWAFAAPSSFPVQASTSASLPVTQSSSSTFSSCTKQSSLRAFSTNQVFHYSSLSSTSGLDIASAGPKDYTVAHWAGRPEWRSLLSFVPCFRVLPLLLPCDWRTRWSGADFPPTILSHLFINFVLSQRVIGMWVYNLWDSTFP